MLAYHSRQFVTTTIFISNDCYVSGKTNQCFGFTGRFKFWRQTIFFSSRVRFGKLLRFNETLFRVKKFRFSVSLIFGNFRDSFETCSDPKPEPKPGPKMAAGARFYRDIVFFKHFFPSAARFEPTSPGREPVGLTADR